MVDEIEAMYAETRRETGLAAISPAVRAAMAKVERHRLVPASERAAAYRNHPLPIGQGQTISQPYIVALSADLLAPRSGDTVLEVGTGSGYQAAVLAEIVAKVCSIELLDSLARTAEKNLKELGYGNIEFRTGDGYQGWPERAPFDGIVVTAAAPRVPPRLVEQLRPGGRMVIPLGAPGGMQVLMLLVKREDGTLEEKQVLPVRFVPLVPGGGRQGGA
ncbi:MAG TPA: protein-L-isoaspartate(D-aspartate) O-methyltransferase [Burkholderiales bacterium]|nr:protein-L-isoaspartate(D-aspartate) O-methyltransferase [Burkholderiales bacterium]